MNYQTALEKLEEMIEVLYKVRSEAGKNNSGGTGKNNKSNQQGE